MKVSKFGHACLMVEEKEARVLIDPGIFSKGFESITGLNAVLITHCHGDHLYVPSIRIVLQNNPEASVICDAQSAVQLSEAGLNPRVVSAGDRIDVGMDIEVIGETHAVIHSDLPDLINQGYLLNDRMFHPGDELTKPAKAIEILAVPIGAPWLKSGEVIDYLREVRPTIAIPIHDAVLAFPQMVHDLVAKLGPDSLDYRVIADGDSIELR